MGIILIIAIIGLLLFIMALKKEKKEKWKEFKTPEEYIEFLKPHVEFVNSLGMDRRIPIAHSALEIGWGKYPIKDCKTGKNSFNLFGIKWRKGCLIENYVTTLTKEWDKEKQEYVSIYATFRAYKTIKESIEDYINLIRNRYPESWKNRSDYIAYFKWLQAEGYATEKEFANRLISIVDTRLKNI